MRSLVVASVLALALANASEAGALVTQGYRVIGSDSFVAGPDGREATVAYRGHQTLSLRKEGAATKYSARVTYVRTERGSRQDGVAVFATDLSGEGDQRDEERGDPYYLTILNQPFVIQLDAQTLRDLADLRAEVPFEAPAPITGAPLHGSLRHAPGVAFGSIQTVGAVFAAAGPIHGSIPGHSEMQLDGALKMTSTASYDPQTALLVALDATLVITGTVVQGSTTKPVHLVYRRTIRAEPPLALAERLAR